VGCKQSGCANMCSVFVYPYCYEHIETKISEHHRSTGQPPQGVYNHFLPTHSETMGWSCGALSAVLNVYLWLEYSKLSFFTNFELIFTTL